MEVKPHRSPLTCLLPAFALVLAIPFFFADGGEAAPAGPPIASTPREGPASAPSNDRLFGLVREHAESCVMDLERGGVRSCPLSLPVVTARYVSARKPVDFVVTLVTLASDSRDPKLSAAAVTVFADHFDELGDDGKQWNASREVTMASIKLWLTLSDARGARLARAVAELAALSGDLDPLFTAAAHHPAQDARATAYRSVARYGGLPALRRVRAVSERPGGDPRDALDAARAMNLADEELRREVCGWGRRYLPNAAPETAASAARLMGVCGAAYDGPLLSEAVRRLDTRSRDGRSAYRGPFADAMSALTADTAQRRERLRAFFVRVVSTAAVLDDVRASTLKNLPRKLYDLETYKILVRFEEHPNRAVATAALAARNEMDRDRGAQWARRLGPPRFARVR